MHQPGVLLPAALTAVTTVTLPWQYIIQPHTSKVRFLLPTPGNGTVFRSIMAQSGVDLDEATASTAQKLLSQLGSGQLLATLGDGSLVEQLGSMYDQLVKGGWVGLLVG